MKVILACRRPRCGSTRLWTIRLRFDLDEINATLTDPFAGGSAPGPGLALAPELSHLMRRLQGDPMGQPFRQVIRHCLETPPAASTPAERARAVRPIRWLLHQVGTSGLALISAGYLRPNDVSLLAAELPTMRDWIGLANRETQTFPVMDFREAMQAVGLVRKSSGRLGLTKAGLKGAGDPERVWRHLLDRLPTGSEKSRTAPADGCTSCGWGTVMSTRMT